MSHPRYNAIDLLNSNISKPDTLDYIEFKLDNISFRCYGILHGITGGLNHEYRKFVKDSIKNISGIKLAEKGMKQLYAGCGIDEELEDWAVLRPIDCIVMGFQLLADPRCLWMITIDALRERCRKQDAFVTNHRQNISDLGESTYFHYLNEQERREIAGFLQSEQAISLDLKSMSHWYGAIIPKPRHQRIDHPQWRRLLLLERVMHIPCRSIHMLYYALSYAKKHDLKQVNLLVGETHNTDMYYLALHAEEFKKTLDQQQIIIMEKIINHASQLAVDSGYWSKAKRFINKMFYLVNLLTGACIAFGLYFMFFRWIFN